MLYAVDQVQLQTQQEAQNQNTETDYCDWCACTVQSPAPAVREEMSWQNTYSLSGRQQEQFNWNGQLSSQFASKSQVAPPRALIKAKVPWSAQRGNLSEKVSPENSERLFICSCLCSILNKLTLEKFDLLTEQLLDSGITSADILKDVVSLIFERAIFEPTFCPMYAQLCYEVSCNLPSFPAEEPGGRMITFKRVLLNNCQVASEIASETADVRVEFSTFIGPDQAMKIRDMERILKRRTLGNILLIGELSKRMMVPQKIGHHVAKELLGSDRKACPDKHVQTICKFFHATGKQLDVNRNSRQVNDTHFIKIKELLANPRLTPRSKFMVRDLIDLRSNNWVPRHAEGQLLPGVLISRDHVIIHPCKITQEMNLSTSGLSGPQIGGIQGARFEGFVGAHREIVRESFEESVRLCCKSGDGETGVRGGEDCTGGTGGTNLEAQR